MNNLQPGPLVKKEWEVYSTQNFDLMPNGTVWNQLFQKRNIIKNGFVPMNYA